MAASRPNPAPPSVRAEVAKFALAGLAALLVLALVGWLVLSRATRDEAIADAKRLTEVDARTAIEPNLADALASGDRRGRRRAPPGGCARGGAADAGGGPPS